MNAIQTLVNAISQHSGAEIKQAKERALCGKPTVKGGPCKYPTYGARVCPTHSLTPKQLAARNRKVAKKFAFNNPDGFTAQRSAAGRAGFIATGEKIGWETANNIARDYRLNKPSILELWVIDILENDLGLSPSYYEREAQIDGDPRFVDFKINNSVIEVGKHGARTDRKIEWLHSLGYSTHIVDVNGQDVCDTSEKAKSEKAKLMTFVKAALADKQAPTFDELPF